MAIITRQTGTYNQRRYGRPWIATVDFSENSRGEFVFGTWTGDHYNGGAGTLTIEANAGDMVAIGQKDNRDARNSAPDFYVVTADARLKHVGDKGAAYKFFLDRKSAGPDTNTLMAERAQLLARVAEIDAILGENA